MGRQGRPKKPKEDDYPLHNPLLDMGKPHVTDFSNGIERERREEAERAANAKPFVLPPRRPAPRVTVDGVALEDAAIGHVDGWSRLTGTLHARVGARPVVVVDGVWVAARVVDLKVDDRRIFAATWKDEEHTNGG